VEPHPRTPEVEAADQVLDAAIQQWAEAYELVEPGDILTEYVVVLAAQNPTTERPGRTRYSWGSRHDAMPLHHVLGLLEVGAAAADASTDDDGWIDP
jgi:hypothetical protein